MRREPLIIGAGPAGCAAAITLAQAGYRPTVLERSAGPADKVCGDFLSVDAIRRAQALGVDPLALGAAPIRRIVVASGARAADATLPFPACGLTRRTLDAALLARVQSAGATVRTGETVRHLVHASGTWIARTGDGAALEAETVFLATGKHDLRDLPRARDVRNAIGMKMYFAPAAGPAKALAGTIALTLFPGGYAGMQPVEDNRIVLCIAIRPEAFRHHGGSWPGLIAAIGQRNPRFAAMLDGATPLLSRPLAVGGIPYGYQARPMAEGGLFRLGDQAAVIASLTGDGMAIALHSGQDAAAAWLEGVPATDYQSGLARTLRGQMQLAGLLHRACMTGWLQPGLVLGAGLFPGLLRHAADRTRLRHRPSRREGTNASRVSNHGEVL
ncbi:MAG TPA: FAD-dependent oxidoreductase [Rhodopila sp.]|nr:FAD-dependent oxidoreductase [Rhodopila sp.]